MKCLASAPLVRYAWSDYHHSRMDWTQGTTGTVSPEEITGERGFFTIPSADHAFIPEALLKIAVKVAKVRPDAEGYFSIHRSALSGRILVFQPVSKAQAGGAENDPYGFIRRYPALNEVRVERSVWRWISAVFPCTLYAWHFEGKVYIREPLTAEDWLLSQPRIDGRTEEIRKVRSLCEYRNGFPCIEKKKRK